MTSIHILKPLQGASPVESWVTLTETDQPTTENVRRLEGTQPSTQRDAEIDLTGQVAPEGKKTRVTATLWEDEGTLVFQVESNAVCVARREDNHHVNGTKLLNVAGLPRGQRDALLKAEKTRHVVKTGPMHLKGVWIPYDQALELANKMKITELVYPLFVHDIGALLYHPSNPARYVPGNDHRMADPRPDEAREPGTRGYESVSARISHYPTPPHSSSSLSHYAGNTSHARGGPGSTTGMIDPRPDKVRERSTRRYDSGSNRAYHYPTPPQSHSSRPVSDPGATRYVAVTHARSKVSTGHSIVSKSVDDYQSRNDADELAVKLASACCCVLLHLLDKKRDRGRGSVDQRQRDIAIALPDVDLAGLIPLPQSKWKEVAHSQATERDLWLELSTDMLQIWCNDAREAFQLAGGHGSTTWSMALEKLAEMSKLLLTRLVNLSSSQRSPELVPLHRALHDASQAADAAIAYRLDGESSDDEDEAVYGNSQSDSFEEDISDIVQDLIDLSPALMTAPPTTDIRRVPEDDLLRKSTLVSTDTVSEDDLFLLQLRERENLPWEDVVARFRKDKGKGFQVAALQMRYKELHQRLTASEVAGEQSATHVSYSTALSSLGGSKERKYVQDVRAHMLTHQTHRPEKCPVQTCEYHEMGFKSKDDRVRHTMNHYEGKLICDFCPTSSSEVKKSFENADVFKDHLSQVHQVGKITPVGTGTRDMEVHNQAQSGQCSVCETTLVGAQELYEHLDECVVSAVQRAAKCEGETTATPSPRGLDVDPVFPSWNVEQPLAPQRLSDYTFSYVYDGDVSDREQFGMSRYTSARTIDSAYYSIGSAAIDKAEIMDSPADPFIVQETEMSAALTIPTTAESNTYARARKRTRIPHTAVERRYRENLNAHLERLRQSVPYVASRLPSGNAAARPSEMSAAIGEGAKRSKCEILNSAIEYIKALESDLAAFKRENVDLGAPAQGLHVVGEGQGQGWHMGGLGRRGGHGE